MTRDRASCDAPRNVGAICVKQSAPIPVQRKKGKLMDRITQRLDAIVCEVAAVLWLMRVGGR